MAFSLNVGIVCGVARMAYIAQLSCPECGHRNAQNLSEFAEYVHCNAFRQDAARILSLHLDDSG